MAVAANLLARGNSRQEEGHGGDQAELLHPLVRRFGAQRGWASGSLGPFNSLERQALTLPYLRPALDSLPFIQANRRIFFLEIWLGTFLRGQTGEPALHTVRQYLDEHPDLPQDLRRKVLQHAEELERTVRIWGGRISAPLVSH